VLLVHGLGSNRHDLDYPDEKYSLAWFLHAAGFDTWVIELRGAGHSNNRIKKQLLGFHFDDYVFHDLPAAFKRIEDETGCPDVHWAGHSMGGMLAYAVLATLPGRLRSAATMGAPAMQKTSHAEFEFVVPFLLPILKRVPCFWGYKRMLQVGSYVTKYTAPILGHYLFNVANCDFGDLGRIARVAIDDVPSGVNLDLLKWYHKRRMTLAYGTIDVLDAVARSTVPLQVIAGKTDRLTPLEDVRIPYDLSSALSKELVVCGREHGFSSDYGHVDLVFGRRAKDEIFPRIRDWFVRHDLPAASPAPAQGTRAAAKLER
jgi:pimeloyl-ACP methyl ester carboxylesterase